MRILLFHPDAASHNLLQYVIGRHSLLVRMIPLHYKFECGIRMSCYCLRQKKSQVHCNISLCFYLPIPTVYIARWNCCFIWQGVNVLFLREMENKLQTNTIFYLWQSTSNQNNLFLSSSRNDKGRPFRFQMFNELHEKHLINPLFSSFIELSRALCDEQCISWTLSDIILGRFFATIMLSKCPS